MGKHRADATGRLAARALAATLACLAGSSGTAFAATAYDNIPRTLTNPVSVGGCVVDDSRVRPDAALPQITNLASVYEIDLAAWGIPNDGSDAETTTAGLNAAIAWARGEGHGTVRVPAGTYLVGEELYPWYMSGVVLPGNIHLELDPAATLQMVPNDKAFYCIVDIPGESDVKLSGGTLRGDRPAHTYAGGGSHEFGYGICVGSTGGSERVLIENMTIFDATGDGITVNDAPGVSRDITIRGNDIHHHRRQGISVVGGADVVIEDNSIHDIGGTDFASGTDPQFGIDIEATLGDNDNRNFLIRGNSFTDNQGGDFVNTGGRNVWLIGNTMSNAGLVEPQGDAPIILWHKGDHIIRDNVVSSSIGNGNGQWALVSYPLGTRPDALDIIENNTFHGGGINVGGGDHASVMAHVRIAGNRIDGHNVVAAKIPCLQFDDNEVLDNGTGWAFLLRNVYGEAAGNRRNGAAVDIPLTPDEMFDELLGAAAAAPHGAAVLHDNGPLVTGSGTGAGGSDVSVVQTWMGNYSYGVNAGKAAAYRLADDFTVPPGGWTISRVRFFAYGAAAPAALNLRIWDGAPDAPGSSIIHGDASTNRLTGVNASHIHRTAPDAPTAVSRPILQLTAAINDLALPAGTYWLDWQIDAGTEASWSPFVTLDDVPLKPGANALQFDPDAGAWTRVRDAGSNKSQDLPFVLESAARVDVIFADGFDA